jgi:LacI family transcriptional regulator
MGRIKKSVTIKDIAEAAGVSISTVSRVLNEKHDVSAETYNRVQEIVAELGYASSLAARGMRSQRTNVIGLIMPDIASAYSIGVMQGVNRAITQVDYDLIVYTNGDFHKYTTADQEKYYVSLLGGSITDGVIVVTPSASEFTSTAPLVAIDPNTDSSSYPAILATNRDGALAVMQYLTDLGHQRIGFIEGRPTLMSSVRRHAGYKEGLETAGIPYDSALVQAGDYSKETGVLSAHKLLSLPTPPTAIFAANDQTAFGVYEAASEMGLAIPADLSVVGFDNIPATKYSEPPLTSVDQTIDGLGYIATMQLIDLINGEEINPEIYKVPTKLIIRDSCLPFQK